MPFPHNCPTSEPNKHKSTRTSPTTDRICLGTPFDSSVLTPPQTHLRRQTMFRDFPNISLHFSMVFPDFSICLFDSSMVLFNFSAVLIDFPWFCSILLGFCSILPLCYLSVSNAYPNAPPTIPTVAPYKRFCSFLPWFYFRASTP